MHIGHKHAFRALHVAKFKNVSLPGLYELRTFAAPSWTIYYVSEFDVVIPYYGDSEGQFLSHDLLTSHQQHFRTRRDAHSSHNDHLNFHIHSAATSRLQLNVSRSHSFIAPDYKIHRRKTVVKHGKHVKETVVESADHDLSCFYTGSLKDSPLDRVSIAVCNGMVSKW